jgi:D-serine dehydratase
MASLTQFSDLAAGRPLLWLNPTLAPQGNAGELTRDDMLAAQERLHRFAPLLMRLFPELQASGGTIESPLVETPALQQALGVGAEHGRLWIKADHSLPIAGSIKARGGFHEVLEFAEKLAVEHGLLAGDASHAQLAEAPARQLFNRYEVAVGSTGNLGLSIGVMASALGFRATVHMSSDAKEWKKERLRNRGVKVVEHAGDYEQAVAAGRAEAEQDPCSHFVDDERSLSLLLGYSAAAPRLQQQLAAAGIAVDAEHPLFVYLPCGVGGAPGGIAFGLKQLFGPHVHCFFAEPTQSPCFMLRMMDGPGTERSVYDIGLSNRTEADGLAVPRASELAASLMQPLLSGVYTVEDAQLFRHLYLAQREEDIRIEPSAAAGLSGPGMLCDSEQGQAYLARHGLSKTMPQATHIAWTTGGLFVPPEEYRRFHERGASLME